MDDDAPDVSAADSVGAAEARSVAELRSALGADFEVLRQIGQGAMASVYLAKDRALGVLVAIKVLHPARATEETARKRFEREARAAASLSDHPNVVAVHRFGRLSDQTPYLVMQFVKGRTMEERLKAEGRLSVADARQVLRDVACALEVAHGKGIVHRDVRPGNVLWDEEKRRALLTDFGIVAILATSGQEVSRLTRTGQLVGSPRYLSPEQLEDKDLTELADIYLLGVLGYELLTGEGPYDARGSADWISAHLQAKPREMHLLRPDVDASLSDLLERCLAKQPKHRPSAGDVIRVLDGSGSGPAPQRAADPLTELVKRRVPAIVVTSLVAGATMIGLADALSEELPPYAMRLTVAFAGAAALAAAVVSWFHGARGRQRAPVTEWLILGFLGLAWLGVSAWIVTG